MNEYIPFKLQSSNFISIIDPAFLDKLSKMEQQQIDELLERYLTLLDEYTRLRQKLSQLQSSIYQNIARANFSGERGMRYGQDHYDERMQALRLLNVHYKEGSNVPVISLTSALEEQNGGDEDEKVQQPHEDEQHEADQQPNEEELDGGSEAKESQGTQPKQQKRKKNKNPLHWFGLFAPMPLRTAQTQSIQAIEEVIPQLASIDMEMQQVEIEVRRARKRRAKTQAAEKKSDTLPTSQ